MIEEQGIERENVTEAEAAEILRRALERPGVKEMMLIYGQWELLRGETQPYCRAATRKRIIATADTSDRMVLRTM